VNVSVCELPELTTLTMFGDMCSAAAGGAIIVMLAEAVFPKESNTVRVTGAAPAVTFAGNVTIIGVPLGVLPEVVWSQTPAAGVPLALKAFEGSLDVVI